MEHIHIPLICFALINFLLILVGYLFILKKLIWPSWMLLIISVLIVYLASVEAHPIIRMLVIIATTFTGMKVIAVAESYKTKPLSLSFKQWCVFAIGWAGMRAQPFETLGGKPLPDAWAKIKFGVSWVLIGLILIIVIHQIVQLPLNAHLLYISTSIILLIAFSLILHFGLLSISAGMWRLSGVATYYLFKAPAKAISLNEFWSKRWNLAFSEMTSITIFRPLRKTTGSGFALLLAFAFSGILHELALSVPVNSGYGLPLLYFMIQGIMVLVEKKIIGWPMFKNVYLARAWVFFWLVIPMPLLFHDQFIKAVVWPLAGLAIPI